MLLGPGADSGLLDVETMAVFYLTGSRNADIADKFQCGVSSSTWDVTLTGDIVMEVSGQMPSNAAVW